MNRTARITESFPRRPTLDQIRARLHAPEWERKKDELAQDQAEPTGRDPRALADVFKRLDDPPTNSEDPTP